MVKFYDPKTAPYRICNSVAKKKKFKIRGKKWERCVLDIKKKVKAQSRRS
jgi:rRNA pseudouridine-1189 N-methylase Emg1 (Nep1/Mra1 family)